MSSVLHMIIGNVIKIKAATKALAQMNYGAKERIFGANLYTFLQHICDQKLNKLSSF